VSNTPPAPDVIQKALVFLMQPGSTSRLCVRYPFMSQQSILTAKNLGITIEYTAEVTVTTSTGTVGSQNFALSAIPRMVTFSNSTSTPPNQTSVDVVYTITALNASKGFYALSVFNQCPPALPLAVGYAGNQVNSSDFRGLFNLSTCTEEIPLMDGLIVGFMGMNAIYVPVGNGT